MLSFCFHFCFSFKTVALVVSLFQSYVFPWPFFVLNFSILKFISLLHIPFPAASRVSKAFHDFQLGLKKLEEYMSCLKGAEVNGCFIEIDRPRHSQVKSDLGSVIQRHIPAGGGWVGILASCSAIRARLCQRRYELAECSEVSHLVQMFLQHGFRAP